MKILLLICLSLFQYGCQKTYDKEICTELSFKKYKGNPPASKEFDDHCADIAIWYSQKKCQQALGKLILHGKKDLLLLEFGSDVMKCFTQYDLKKFLKK